MSLSGSFPPGQDNARLTRQERSQQRHREIAIETALESFTLSPYMNIYSLILLYYSRKRSSLSTNRLSELCQSDREGRPGSKNHRLGKTLFANARNPSISSISKHCSINSSTPTPSLLLICLILIQR